MTQHFYSHGKLLLTGEYVVLDGAKSLAIPTKYGQSLRVSTGNSTGITWKSYAVEGELWLDLQITYEELDHFKIRITDTPKERLLELLNIAQKLNPSFLQQQEALLIETRLEFPNNWGLGSSSTLINNIANWAQIDPYQLLEQSFGGSGYDLACAQATRPIFYQITKGKPHVTAAPLNLSFKEQLFFVHLNKKQNSREAISHYRKQPTYTLSKTISRINKISEELAISKTLHQFESLIIEHEHLISELIGIQPVQQSRFPDYKDGVVKSLGGWGGDFALVTAESVAKMSYFKTKGYTTIIPYSHMEFIEK